MRRSQQGVAAVEFAAVFLVLFSVLYGITTFGAVLYTQQVVSRAAEEGARAVAFLPSPLQPDDTRIKGVVFDALAASFVVPVENSANTASRRSWIAARVGVTVTGTPGSPGGPLVRAQITVSYPYRDNQLLPTLPVLDASRWMPAQLVSQAMAAVQS